MKKIALILCLLASFAHAETNTYDVTAIDGDDGYVEGSVEIDENGSASGFIIKDNVMIEVEGEMSGCGMVDVDGTNPDGVYQKYELYIEE